MLYLDYAATTPLDPRVYEKMLPYVQDVWGNPSSPHSKGREARGALDASRQIMMEILGCKPQELVFTGSGSEAVTLAILGTCAQWKEQHGTPGHVISSTTEHSSTIKALEHIELLGWTVTRLPVDASGQIDLNELSESINDQTALVTLHWANNETGVMYPIDEIIALCRERSIPCHIDAMQAIGILPLPSALPDMLSIAAHKFYGPKGIGMLYVQDAHHLSPLIMGGDQEHGLRPGTENVPGIVGLAHAFELAIAEQPDTYASLTKIQHQFEDAISTIENASINGKNTHRLPSISNIHLPGTSGELLVMQFDKEGICIATGSACTTGASDPSHVLQAMGQSSDEAGSNVRVSFGRGVEVKDVEKVVEALTEFGDRIRIRF